MSPQDLDPSTVLTLLASADAVPAFFLVMGISKGACAERNFSGCSIEAHATLSDARKCAEDSASSDASRRFFVLQCPGNFFEANTGAREADGKVGPTLAEMLPREAMP